MNHAVENVQIGMIKQNCLYGDIKSKPYDCKNAYSSVTWKGFPSQFLLLGSSTGEHIPDLIFEAKAVDGFHTGGLISIPEFCLSFCAKCC